MQSQYDFQADLIQSLYDFKTDLMQSQNDFYEELKIELGFYPLVTAGIALFTSVVTVGVAQVSNQILGSKLDNTLKRLEKSRDGSQKGFGRK